MKKSFLLLPLSALILAACSSDNPAPVQSADGSLQPGVMQPVDGTGATSYGWQSDVKAAEMPSSMTTQPTYQQPAPQPTYSTPVQTQAQTQPKKPVSQDFNIPRDANNLPIYSQIDKGFYQGDSYTVRKGDTMFLIAYIAGKDVRDIAALNNLTEPYQLRVGQTLKLSNSAASASSSAVSNVTPTVTTTTKPAVTYTYENGSLYGSDGSVKLTQTNPTTPTVTTTTQPTVKVTTTTSTPVSAASGVRWQWPTQGSVVSNFSSAEGGNKGIDIAGSKGQAVYAAAAGRVVYAGDAIRGYGNLIIIKHNDDFLSAYAHNDSILVDEQDEVKAGEKIATLGSSGTNSNKLHFEIRYRGKSVDPSRYLPRR